MIDVQNAVISNIVLHGELEEVLDARITDDFFPDPTHLKVWQLVLEHYKDFGDPPTKAAVKKAYPTYKFTETDDPQSYWVKQLQQERKTKLLLDSIQEAAAVLNSDDPGPAQGDEIEAILRMGLAESAHEVSQGRDSDFFSSSERLLERLALRKDNPGYLRGIPTGFDGLDRLIGGYQPEQLVTILGLPKAGKSSIQLASALAVRLSGYRVLYVTFEMSAEEQEDRMLSLLSGVGLTKVLTGTFSNPEYRRIEKSLELRKYLDGFTISSDISSTTTVSGIQAKIQQYRPAAVFIDGAYLMDDERGQEKGSPQALKNLTQDLKRLAQMKRIPIIISTQALMSRSRNGLTAASVGYSQSFAQDSDVLFGQERNAEVETLSMLKVLHNRSGPNGNLHLRFDWGLGLIEEIDQDDYELEVANRKLVSSKSNALDDGDGGW